MTETEIITADGLVKSSPSTIYTFGGGSIDPINPNPADLSIRAIAHALSNQCRWTGHTLRFYSVAEHCVHVANMLPPERALDGLLHDASEAFLSDLARPIKKASGLGEVYEEVEGRLEDVISATYGTRKLALAPWVKEADEAMLWQEAKQLVPHLSEVGTQPPEGTPECQCWPPEEAERQFLQTFSDLTGMPFVGNRPSESVIDCGKKTKYTDPETGGSKEESEARFDLVPPDAHAELAKVYGYGEGKYPSGPDGPNYLRGYPWHLSIASLERHVAKFKAGEDYDPETGKHHLAHAAWHCLTLVVFGLRGLGTDDRKKLTSAVQTDRVCT